MLGLALSFLLTTTEPSLERLRAAVAEAAEKSTGEMGVAIEDLESGLRSDGLGDERPPPRDLLRARRKCFLYPEDYRDSARLRNRDDPDSGALARGRAH